MALRVGCVTLHASAARPKCPCRATAIIYSSCCRVIIDTFYSPKVGNGIEFSKKNPSKCLYIIKDLKASLREIEVKIILLHLLEVKTFNEISKIVSMKEKTVKTCYYRALKKIKKGGKNDD